MNIPETLTHRRKLTEDKENALLDALRKREAEEIVGNSACVYATGSLGRGEMSDLSDLDVFVLRDQKATQPLTNLNGIRLKARLIEVARQLGYPEFSGDGRFIAVHDLRDDVIHKLGTNEDDYANVFTARMLLILESRPLLGRTFYERAVEEVIAVYWRDYSQNSTQFLPVFLMNDILRFWKTLCLNYEERTGRTKSGKLGKRRLHNYKLKHSRLLTCYSAVIGLQGILHRDGGTVSPEAVTELIEMSPTARIEEIARIRSDLSPKVGDILEKYSAFLRICDAGTATLEASFEEQEFKQARLLEARGFGDSVFDLIQTLGAGTPLLRYLVI